MRTNAREKLEIVLFASASRRGGRKGGLGGIPPAEPIVRKISSDFFKYTPQDKIIKKQIITKKIFIFILSLVILGTSYAVAYGATNGQKVPFDTSHCAKQGEQGDVHGMPCCTGFNGVAPNVSPINGNCCYQKNEYPPVGTQFICINCGNGRCETGENKCNCPQDCGTLSACQTPLSSSACQIIGLRKLGKYCSGDKVWLEQKNTNNACDNNFECKSNVCLGEKCVSTSLMQRIIEWLLNFFRL